ncbi:MULTISPECIES: phenolic acid decarboxylase BsdC [Bacillus amyloliquefaciens group]|jgi:4-hydroxybenzoate decarboxylase|uniref:phenolic acid decarboxylase BsdC n=1 Tax=Bacillus amyloliquefaciens group TaxID=1938374 RepID=UPI000B5F59C4|nr:MULTISPECIES: phenolic acid decarboxylase BsdC [Bacillus amyloliquefaciens group]ASB63869.1 4-hydroxy-3-polyprenylbenzoate decarboxylase [Bacillus velezensis]MEC0385380.1 phenolic acid decarboxylase BsdC [Bacillus velezensis]MEC0387478.1 phenolic acid decarboxylase BsdC [Bacillus velezensis]MEC0406565.1 phenolic acid decarboxylase BsdC [Bacillus velezensis]MEE4535461.1 phenolic acid decarboxylase BsdC [Bacillus velezensis]
MAYQDFREFLAALEKEGQLLTVNEEVKPEPDLGAAARAASNLGDKTPALLFNNIYGHHDAQVALNVIGSWPNHAMMLGMPKDTPVKEQFFEFAKRYDAFPVPVKREETAPFHENEITEDINLFDILPLFRINQGDGGYYLDKACVISRDLEDPDNFGKQNVGIYRMQVKGKDRLGIQPVPQHDIAIHLRQAEERGVNLPVTIALGCEPVITTAASTPLLYDQSEYEMAGAIQGEPYRIVKSKLSDLDIPWGAEVVLEGEILAGEREYEGPFGEFTGHYSGGRSMPVIKIKRVYHRNNPIFEHLYLGMPWTECDYMIGINTCVPLYQQLKEAYPNEIVAVNAMYTHGLIAIISTKTRYGGFAKAVGMRALTTPHGLGYCKMVIVVDEDVDPFNLPQVMWALSTKMHPKHDAVIIPDLSVLPLDPGSDPAGMTHKMILDATTPAAPETRGHYSQPLDSPLTTKEWEQKLMDLMNQ